MLQGFQQTSVREMQHRLLEFCSKAMPWFWALPVTNVWPWDTKWLCNHKCSLWSEYYWSQRVIRLGGYSSNPLYESYAPFRIRPDQIQRAQVKDMNRWSRLWWHLPLLLQYISQQRNDREGRLLSLPCKGNLLLIFLLLEIKEKISTAYKQPHIKRQRYHNWQGSCAASEDTWVSSQQFSTTILQEVSGVCKA